MPPKKKTLEQRIDALASQVGKLCVQQPQPSTSRRGVSGNRNRGGGRRVQRNVGSVPIPAARSAASGNTSDASCSVRRKELLATVTLAANTTSAAGIKYLGPDASSPTSQFPWLSTLAKSFSRWKTSHMSLMWQPYVGSNMNGDVAIGVDWTCGEATAATPTIAQIVALTPSKMSAIWNEFTLALPKRKLMSRAWYEVRDNGVQADLVDTMVGYFCYVVKAEASASERELGSFWVEYDITLQGARSK